MRVSPVLLKWLLRFYPPLFLQQIWTISVKHDYSAIDVKLYKSLLNINYNSSIFGGTIYAATDAFYPVLFHQLLSHQGYKVIIWVKSAQVQYIKPARTALLFTIAVTPDELTAVRQLLDKEGKTVRNCTTELYNSAGELCAAVHAEVYIRNLNFQPSQ